MKKFVIIMFRILKIFITDIICSLPIDIVITNNISDKNFQDSEHDYYKFLHEKLTI
jgi:hypothetical protein